MKKLFILLIAINTFASSYSTEIPKIAWVDSKKGLNQRQSPDIKSKVIQLLPYKCKVDIVEFDFSKNIIIDDIRDYWVKIKYQDKTGWVFAGYLIFTEPLDNDSYGKLSNEIISQIENYKGKIHDFFKIELDKVRKYRIEFNKKPEHHFIKYSIDIIRFNKKFPSETEWYEGVSCTRNYVSLSKDFNDFIYSNKNILKSFNSLNWPCAVTNINKKNIDDQKYIEEDIYFMPTDEFFKTLVFFRTNYAIICWVSFDINTWVTSNDIPYLRSDWYYKNINNEFRIRNEGFQYMKIGYGIMSSLNNMLTEK